MGVKQKAPENGMRGINQLHGRWELSLFAIHTHSFINYPETHAMSAAFERGSQRQRQRQRHIPEWVLALPRIDTFRSRAHAASLGGAPQDRRAETQRM